MPKGFGSAKPGKQSYTGFINQVLQVVRDSKGNKKKVYSVLQKNLHLLDEQFLAVFKGWTEAELFQATTTQAANMAARINDFCALLGEFPLGERANNLELVIACYEISLTIFTRSRFPYDWANTQMKLGNAYCDRIRGEKSENLEDAIRYHNAALLEFKRDRFPKMWASTQANLGNAYCDRIWGEKAENLEDAIHCYNAALLEFKRDYFPEMWASTQMNLGTAYSDRIRGEKAENLEDAIHCYDAALLEFKRDRFPKMWAKTQMNLGNAYSDRIRGEKAENLEDAIHCYDAALLEFKPDRFPEMWAKTQANLGSVYRNRIRGEKAENLEDAIRYHNAALLEFKRDRFPENWASTQMNLGNAYCERIQGEKAENLEDAIRYHNAALLEFKRDRFPEDWAGIQMNLGSVYRNRIRGEKAENLEDAIQCLQDALEIFANNSFPDKYVEASYNLGLTYQYAKQWENAYQTYKSAIDTVELLRGEIFSGSEAKQKLAEEWNKLYQGMAEVCLQLSKEDEVIEYIERSKTRNLVEVLATQSQNLQAVGLEIEVEKRRLTAARELQNQGGEGNTEPTRLNQLRRERNAKIDEIIPLQPIRFDEIRGLLDDSTAIMEWYLFGDCFRVFIITRDNDKPLQWQSSQKNWEKLNTWSKGYLDIYNTDKAKWRYKLGSFLEELADILHIQEILDLIPACCESLIIVPHRFLHLLPLHALPVGSQNVLLDKFPGGVSYAPSSQLLKFVKKHPENEEKSFFAIQDPNENLLYTNIEVETIERHFQPTNILKQGSATRDTLMKQPYLDSLQTSQILHFSCHGYFNTNSPADSAIALAGCAVNSDNDGKFNERHRLLANGESIDLDKCLTLGDIFNLDLPNCHLVTLSACETGRTFENTSDEYIGLPSGFLKAGSSSVISSLWSVDDFATTLLMIRFYDNLPSLSTAKALFEAQCWLRVSTQAKLIEWTENHPKINAQHKLTIQKYLRTWFKPDQIPLNKPEAWAGFCAIGY
jgi:CHAT domain-containing protein